MNLLLNRAIRTIKGEPESSIAIAIALYNINPMEMREKYKETFVKN